MAKKKNSNLVVTKTYKFDLNKVDFEICAEWIIEDINNHWFDYVLGKAKPLGITQQDLSEEQLDYIQYSLREQLLCKLKDMLGIGQQ